jgi:CrcB protein
MGGLTTYSAFNNETLGLLEEGRLGAAALNVGVTLVGCLGCGVAGLKLGSLIVRQVG